MILSTHASSMVARDLDPLNGNKGRSRPGEMLPDVEVDYAFKRSLVCPACGAPGGGMEVYEH